MGRKFCKTFYIVLIILIVFSLTFLLVACDKDKNANISFNSNGGSLVENSNLATLQELPIPSKDGHTFDGWYFDDETFSKEFSLEDAIKNDIQVYAKWSLQKHEVTFTSNGGVCISGETTQIVEHGKLPILPTFIKNGYTFVGFDKKVVETTSDIIYNASYAPNMYEITLYDGIETKKISATFGNALHTDLAAPEKLDSSFGGYYTLENGEGKKYLDENMQGVNAWEKSEKATLYAKWYNKISFDKQEGEGGSDYAEAVLGQDMPVACAPKRPLFTFLGYFSEVDGKGTKYYDENMTSLVKWNNNFDITLYAYFEESEYTITFDKQSGTGGSDFVKVRYEQVLPEALIPTKAGYKFLGYFSKIVDGIMYYDENMVSETVWNNDYSATAFASWEKLEGTKGVIFERTEENTYRVVGYNGNDTEIVIPATYQEKKVVEIADNAFQDNYKIVKVVISLGVKRIGEFAFSNCISLKSAILPSSLLELDSCAFLNCISLESISLSDNLKSVENNTFFGCSNLKKVDFGKGIENIRENAFYGCLSLIEMILPESLTHIGDRAFSGCSYLESVQLPDNLLYIGNSAFFQCITLSNIVLPDKLLYIGDSAFENCSIYNITIPNSVAYIGHRAFYSVSAHNVFVENETPFAIGLYAFAENVNIIIDVDSVATFKNSVGWKNYLGIYSLDDIDEQGFLMENSCLLSYTGTSEEIIVPKEITSIASGAFMGVNGNISFEENSALVTIDYKTFYLYKGKEITLPDSITSIDGGSFDTAVNLETITLSTSLVNAGNNLFKNNAKLKNVFLNNITPPSAIGDYDYSSVNLYVPESSQFEYESHPFWGRFNIVTVKGD